LNANKSGGETKEKFATSPKEVSEQKMEKGRTIGEREGKGSQREKKKKKKGVGASRDAEAGTFSMKREFKYTESANGTGPAKRKV